MIIFVAKNYLWPLVQLNMSQHPTYMRGLDWAATQAKIIWCFFKHRVVQRLDNTFQGINRYPVDKC